MYSRFSSHAVTISLLCNFASLTPLGSLCKPDTTGFPLNVTYVRPAQVGERLVARSELLHLGRRSASLTVRVSDGAGRLMAHGSVTLMVLQEPGGEGTE